MVLKVMAPSPQLKKEGPEPYTKFRTQPVIRFIKKNLFTVDVL